MLPPVILMQRLARTLNPTLVAGELPSWEILRISPRRRYMALFPSPGLPYRAPTDDFPMSSYDFLGLPMTS